MAIVSSNALGSSVGPEDMQKTVNSRVTMRVFMSPGSRYSQATRYSRRRLCMPSIEQSMMGGDGRNGPRQASNGRGSDATVSKIGM